MGDRVRKSTAAPIDLSTIEELADGDITLLSELAAMFKRHTSEAIAKVRMAIAARQLQDVAQIAHTCIGFTALLGLTTLVPILRQLEHVASLEPAPALWAEELTRLVAQWEQEFERVNQILLSGTNRSGAP